MIERIHFREITSTNDYAKELIKEKEIIAVSCDFQTTGKGRSSKTWEGSYGKNVYLSFALNHKHIVAYSVPSIYQSLGCLIVYNTLSKFVYLDKLRIKYPNDVYILQDNFKKISGVLIEHSSSGKKAENTIIGIGVNVNQESFSDELKETASSLILSGVKIDLEKIYSELIYQFELLIKLPEHEVYRQWIEKINLTNKNINILGIDGIWRLQNVNPDCSLNLINQDNILKRIDNGDSIRYELQ